MAGKMSNPMFFGVILMAFFCSSRPDIGFTATRHDIVITDLAERQVMVPRTTRKVVPLGGALRFMTYMASLDLVAGVENIERKWSSPGRLYGLATAELAKKLPVIGEGGPGKLPDFEQIISVWPDVIITMGVDNSQVKTIQEKTGIPVVVLNYGTPGALQMDKVKKSIKLLGDLLNRKDRAATLITYMDQQFTDLATRTSDISKVIRPDVYVGALSFKGTQGITSTEPRHAPLSWINGRNVADEIRRQGHAFIDPEKLLQWNPEVIFLDAGSLDVVMDDYAKKPGYYRRLQAVKDGRVFLSMPYNYYHTNIEIALADAFFMGKCIFPGRFSDIDPVAKANEIFQFFIGIKAYGQLEKEYHGFGRVNFGEGGLGRGEN